MGCSPVLLISMPFGPAQQPSIGLSLLQGCLLERGIESKVRYFSLDFYHEIGADIYDRLSKGEPTTVDLAAEWVFSGQLFPQDDFATDMYINEILLGNDPKHSVPHGNKTVSPEFINNLKDARRKAKNFLETCLKEIIELKPQVVGLTSVFQQHVASIALAKMIKAHSSQIKVVLGGANCEGIMGVELLKQFDFIDAVVSGEGEVAFTELVECALKNQDFSHIQGVITRTNLVNQSKFPQNASSLTSLDGLPIPNYDDYFDQLEKLGGLIDSMPRLLFETSRGCWWGEKHHCTFCGLNGGNMSFRSKSPKRALDELMQLTTRYSAGSIAVVDNILDMSYFKTFIPELAAQNLKLNLFYEVKANLRKSQVALLKEARIKEIQPGIESLSSHVLEIMNKGIKSLQNIQLLKWCKEYDITAYWNILWGFPGETPQDYLDTEKIISKIIHLYPPGVATHIRLDRFSPNFDQADQFGITEIRPYPAYRHIYSGLSDNAIKNIAYYFTFGTLENHNETSNYTKELAIKIAVWQKSYEFSDLFYVDKNDKLTIFDFRSIHNPPQIILEGLSRTLYLKCDQIQGLTQLTSLVLELGIANSPQIVIREHLTHLINAGLMLEENETFLSLAIPVGIYSPSSTLFRRLEELQKYNHSA